MDITKRRQIWIALSNFYLDTELQDFHYNHIASICRKVKCSYEEAQEIDRTEVFPTLYKNLLSVAGVWGAFDEEWLIEECTKNHHKKNKLLFRFKTYIKLFIAGGHFTNNWRTFNRVLNTR